MFINLPKVIQVSQDFMGLSPEEPYDTGLSSNWRSQETLVLALGSWGLDLALVLTSHAILGTTWNCILTSKIKR